MSAEQVQPFAPHDLSDFWNVIMFDLQGRELTLPGDTNRLLLHSCCAPCSGEVMEAITVPGIAVLRR